MPKLTPHAGIYFWRHLGTDGRGGTARELSLRYLRAHRVRYLVAEINAFIEGVQKRVKAGTHWYQSCHDEANEQPLVELKVVSAPKAKAPVKAPAKAQAKKAPAKKKKAKR